VDWAAIWLELVSLNYRMKC